MNLYIEFPPGRAPPWALAHPLSSRCASAPAAYTASLRLHFLRESVDGIGVNGGGY
jgi:hypothetical protein